MSIRKFTQLVKTFKEYGKPTTHYVEDGIPFYVNQFWEQKQRSAHSLHEISYRACYRAELPEFFIHHLTSKQSVVLDPFMGRGTTVLQARLMNRKSLGNDISPLSTLLIEPRLKCPTIEEITERLTILDKLPKNGPLVKDLLHFYHIKTLRKLTNLRHYFLTTDLDHIDRWIRMVCINRLTGHSPGFFSVYTLPPNQAVSVARQKKINAKYNNAPPERDVQDIILKKSRTLLKDGSINLDKASTLLVGRSNELNVTSKSVDLTVTSPPFLDVVDYQQDNWLRMWFAGIDQVNITQTRKIDEWEALILKTLKELYRVTRPGGLVAFEVGNIKRHELDKAVWRLASKTRFKPHFIMIHDAKFTKTSNTWGVANNTGGTNTNRVILLERPT